MRAGARMIQESANLICRFRREDVLELAGLLFDLRFALEGQAVGEKALGKTVTANDVGGLLSSAWSEFDYHAAIPASGRSWL